MINDIEKYKEINHLSTNTCQTEQNQILDA